MRSGTSSQFGDCKRNGGDDHMTLAEFAKGTTTFVVVIVAGFLSETYLDRHLAASEADKKATSSDSVDASAPSTSSAACVGKDGAWKNWPWSNVPILSPKCREDR
jgi:hypothetical protein